MRRTNLSVPDLMMIVGTRAALGLGIGLMIADKLNPETRKGAAVALIAVGAISTIPLAAILLSKKQEFESNPEAL